MELELDFMGSYCSTGAFVINGKQADSEDFGSSHDADPGSDEDYGCGDRQFCGKGSTPEVLSKYGISQSEYNLVVGQLEVGLSFGSCGWCV
jgi:hypothetical protein